jgi:hypothetical protein
MCKIMNLMTLSYGKENSCDNFLFISLIFHYFGDRKCACSVMALCQQKLTQSRSKSCSTSQFFDSFRVRGSFDHERLTFLKRHHPVPWRDSISRPITPVSPGCRRRRYHYIDHAARAWGINFCLLPNVDDLDSTGLGNLDLCFFLRSCSVTQTNTPNMCVD